MKTKKQFSGVLGMLILFLVFGCSGSDNTDREEEFSLPDYDYFLRYEADGQVEEFLWDYEKKVWIAAALNSSEEGGNFFIANNGSLVNGISINLITAEPVVVGEKYTEENIEQLHATYTNGGFYSAGYAAVNSEFSTTDFEIIITDLSSDEVRGEFSGTFDGDEESVSITNGEFFVLLATD